MDDQIKSKLVTGILASYFLLLLVFILILSLVVRYRRKKKENELLSEQYKQALLLAELEIKEQTLLHIGRELHDNLGLKASLIKLQLNTLPTIPIQGVPEKIETTKEFIRELILDIKQLAVSLNSDQVARFGLVSGLENESEKLRRTGIWQVEFKKDGAFPSFDPAINVILFRMSQEILNNMIKHSQGTMAIIHLSTDEKKAILAFQDNGRGFDPEVAQGSGGSGFNNLKHRAKLIHADLAIESQPENGCKITIQLPLASYGSPIEFKDSPGR